MAESTPAPSWLALSGRWTVGPEGNPIEYQPPPQTGTPDDPVISLILSDQVLAEGEIFVSAVLGATPPNVPAVPQELHLLSSARILFGYDAGSNQYVSVGIGGNAAAAYLVSAYSQGSPTNLASTGTWRTIESGREYKLRASVIAQTVKLWVDGVKVVDQTIASLVGGQVGLLASGPHPVRFQDFRAESRKPTGFVVMQFGAPFDSIYDEVITPVARAAGVELRRGDDIVGPGAILGDIIGEIANASVIVAEITTANPNVFYELGYAQALGKPTILLAQRRESLPFDVSGMRTIYYDDTISGKRTVENDLRRHFQAIFGTRTAQT